MSSRSSSSRAVPSGTPIGEEASAGVDAAEFSFRFTPAYRWSGLLFGIGPHSARVTVGGSVFEARFGPWKVTTPLANIAGTTTTGPYRWHRTAGPARYSLADHGLTFATNGDLGLRIAFHEPVTGVEPMRVLHHPSLTVTVTDVDRLEQALRTHIVTEPELAPGSAPAPSTEVSHPRR